MRLKPENLSNVPLILVIPSLIFKILVIFLVVYISISYISAVVGGKDFSYRVNKPLQTHSSILIQPVMDLIGNSKVSYWYDYSKIEKKQIPENISSLNIRSDSNTRNLQEKMFWRNTKASINGVNTAVIVEPADYTGKWSLVYCIIDKDFCEQSNILATGKVKLISDGQQQIWGKDEQGNFLQLKLIKYSQRSDNPEILHI